jgi:hypothetical protein
LQAGRERTEYFDSTHDFTVMMFVRWVDGGGWMAWWLAIEAASAGDRDRSHNSMHVAAFGL